MGLAPNFRIYIGRLVVAVESSSRELIHPSFAIPFKEHMHSHLGNCLGVSMCQPCQLRRQNEDVVEALGPLRSVVTVDTVHKVNII